MKTKHKWIIRAEKKWLYSNTNKDSFWRQGKRLGQRIIGHSWIKKKVLSVALLCLEVWGNENIFKQQCKVSQEDY